MPCAARAWVRGKVNWPELKKVALSSLYTHIYYRFSSLVLIDYVVSNVTVRILLYKSDLMFTLLPDNFNNIIQNVLHWWQWERLWGRHHRWRERESDDNDNIDDSSLHQVKYCFAYTLPFTWNIEISKFFRLSTDSVHEPGLHIKIQMMIDVSDFFHSPPPAT